jgi:hypothetical protein
MGDNTRMTRVYRSRVDWWLGAVLAAGGGVSLVSSVAALVAGAPPAPALLGIVAGVGLPCWLLLGTTYALDDTTLRVRSGPLRWRIPLADITGTAPTSNPLSSPALSLRRLRIEYGAGRSLMISPRDEDDFLRELGARSARARERREPALGAGREPSAS